MTIAIVFNYITIAFAESKDFIPQSKSLRETLIKLQKTILPSPINSTLISFEDLHLVSTRDEKLDIEAADINEREPTESEKNCIDFIKCLKNEYSEILDLYNILDPIIFSKKDPSILLLLTEKIKRLTSEWEGYFGNICNISSEKNIPGIVARNIVRYLEVGAKLNAKQVEVSTRLKRIGPNSEKLLYTSNQKIKAIFTKIPSSNLPPELSQIIAKIVQDDEIRVIKKTLKSSQVRIKKIENNSEIEDYSISSLPSITPKQFSNSSHPHKRSKKSTRSENIIVDSPNVNNNNPSQKKQYTNATSNNEIEDREFEASILDDFASVDESSESIKGLMSEILFNGEKDYSKVDLNMIYGKNIGKQAMVNTIIDSQQIGIQEPMKKEKWTYELLATSVAISECALNIAEKFKLILQNVHNIKIEICLMIDNSGSMGWGSKPVHVAETIALFIETIRKLEFPFAIARFGNVDDKFSILKKFHDEFSYLKGQHILEHLTYDQATKPATALQRVAREVWPQNLSEDEKKSVQRIVIMVTDGLTQETDINDYLGTCSSKNIELCIIHLMEGIPENIIVPLRQLIEHALIVSKSVMKSQELPLTLEDVLSSKFSRLASNVKIIPAIDEPFSYQLRSPKYERKQNRISLSSLLNSNTSELLQNSDVLKDNLWRTSSGNDDQEIYDIKYDPSPNVNLLSQYLTQNNNRELQSNDNSDNEEFAVFQSSFSNHFQKMTSVLEEMMPFNKFTRKKASSKGSSLYLPGLIKAVISDYNYKKFFSVKQAGGRREYSVSLILDTSLSMRGNLTISSLQTLLIFLGALEKMTIANINILTFSEEISIIKSNSDPMNKEIIYKLLNNISMIDDKDTGDCGTNDAGAILCSLDLFKQSNSKGPKFIFIFTDGQSTNKMKLKKVLSLAKQQGVEVIAIGVGFENFLLGNYSKWIASISPFLVHEALREILSSNFILEKPYIPFRQQQITNFDEINSIYEANIKNKAFPNLPQLLDQEREFHLVQSGGGGGVTTVDIGFCIDITGSMNIFLRQVIQQISFICNNLQDEIKKQMNNINCNIVFRFGFLAYRDHGDIDQFIEFPHSDNLQNFLHELNQLKAKGGGDLAEDCLSAMKRMANWNSWQSKVKYLVLIFDAPPHGSIYHNNQIDDNIPNGIISSHEVLSSLVQKEIDLITITANPSFTEQTELILSKEMKSLGGKIECAYLSDNPAALPSGFHIIFVLDESGSMRGSNWAELVKSYNSFIQRRRGDQSNDLVSVIQFNDSARDVFTHYNLNKCPSDLSISGGGTNFTNALSTTISLMNRSKNYSHIPVVIFMTDGQAEDASSLAIQMRSNFPNMIFNGIGFGNDNFSVLRQITSSAGGTFAVAKVGELENAFIGISNSISQTASQMLAKNIGQKIAEAVSYRIVLDHL